MKIITHEFRQLHMSHKALLFYTNLADSQDVRVEAYDMDEKGRPINAHPLTVNESKALATSLSKSRNVYTGFLQYNGVLPAHLLFVDASDEGYALWYTPAQKARLLFKEGLTIPNGEAQLPPLIWRATSKHVELYAVSSSERPTGETPLYHAPFFNVYLDGRVCMGNVDIDFDEDCNLLDFMNGWEHYFFNSYFSHSISGSPIQGNLVSVWQQLVANPQQPFPLEVLKLNGKTVNDLIV